MARKLMLTLSAGLSLSACAGWRLPERQNVADHVDLLARALASDAQTRESLWRKAPPAKRSQSAALDRALLQSVPGHSGYDPGAAEAALKELIDDGPPPDLESLAKLRLVELKSEGRLAAECRQENAQLKQRLSRVVDIERNLNTDGH